MIKNLTGQRFGRLVVLGDSGQRNEHQLVKWTCICDCGKECLALGYQLQNNIKRSCGCMRKENAFNLGKLNGSNHIKMFKTTVDTNNTSGHRGVIFSKHHNKYIARITVNRVLYHLLIDSDMDKCIRMRKEAEQAVRENRFEDFIAQLKQSKQQTVKQVGAVTADADDLVNKK